MSANLLRLTTDEAISVRDLPQLSGISKEGIAMRLRRVEESGLGFVKPEADRRTRRFFLTAKGRVAHETYAELTRAIERGWKRRSGKDVETFRETLEALVGSGSLEKSPLFEGLQPYPDGWRASVPKPTHLPHFPMILHRGGFPDGS
jgi:DNA-binding MarR family transcriptional regulator